MSICCQWSFPSRFSVDRTGLLCNIVYFMTGCCISYHLGVASIKAREGKSYRLSYLTNYNVVWNAKNNLYKTKNVKELFQHLNSIQITKYICGPAKDIIECQFIFLKIVSFLPKLQCVQPLKIAWNSTGYILALAGTDHCKPAKKNYADKC